jgi:hypothetical protein
LAKSRAPCQANFRNVSCFQLTPANLFYPPPIRDKLATSRFDLERLDWVPRTSAAAALAAPLLPDKPRLKPPQGLPRAEKRAFLEVVNSVRPEHFGLEDAPLVAAYAAILVEERLTRVEIAKARAAGDTAEAAGDGEGAAEAMAAEERWARRHARACQTMVVLARTLRLGPKSRIGGEDRRREGQARPAGLQVWGGEEEAMRPPDWRPWRQ